MNPSFPHGPLPDGLQPLTADEPRHLGPFRVVGRIGAGGMGAVYAGLDDSDIQVAIKCVHRVFADDPEFRSRFAREVALVRRVRAVCVPRFLGADVRADIPWMATEYVPGLTLGAHVREHGPLTGSALIAFAVGVADALATLHRVGVVHRDLKPGNVILSPTGPKVLDFGIARAVEETAITRTGGLVGTPGWIAPEQYRGRPATERSDIHAWATLVAYAATGTHPHGTGDSETMAIRVLSRAPNLDGVPEHLRSLLHRALDQDPERRPNASQVLDELAALVSGEGSTVPLPSREVDVTLVLDEAWTGIGAPGSRPGEWLRHAPPRRPWAARKRRGLTMTATGLSLTLVAGLTMWATVGGGGGEGAAIESEPPNDGVVSDAVGSSEGEGGADDAAGALVDVPEEYRDLYESGTVAVRPVEGRAPVLLRTLEPALGQAGEPLEQLRITFDEVQTGGVTEFSVRAEYLPDFGSLELLSDDFAVGDIIGPEDTEVSLNTPDSRGLLARVDADDPMAEFTLRFLRRSTGVVYYTADRRGTVPLDYAGGFCFGSSGGSGTSFPDLPALAPHDATLTDGSPRDSCAFQDFS
ncbi:MULTISPECIES: serine/threonine-protein kinase [unclassified Nocardiopsis]|uniref:serine/threonine-protein kinase n=1 Tax=Nocardiopsis TaxID=2013 RepID=UPI00387B3E10